MKTLSTILAILLYSGVFVSSAGAQEIFKVPKIRNSENYANMSGQATGLIATSINYAKSLGKSVDDFAYFTGDIFKTSWNKEMGFNGFVNGMIYNSIGFFPGAKITILEQSENMIKYKIILTPEFIKKFPLFNVTLDEYLMFHKGVVLKIGEYLSANYSHEFTGNEINVTIVKK
jgi:hypothetical protein